MFVMWRTGCRAPVAERVAAIEALREPVLEARPLAEQRLQRVYRVTSLNCALKRGRIPRGRRVCAGRAWTTALHGRSRYLGAT